MGLLIAIQQKCEMLSSYVQMTQGKIRIAQEDFNLHMALLNEARNKSDILFELLAYGMLEIRN